MTSSRRGPSSVPSRTQWPALTGDVQPTTARASTSSVTSQSRLSSVWMSTPTPCVPRRSRAAGPARSARRGPGAVRRRRGRRPRRARPRGPRSGSGSRRASRAARSSRPRSSSRTRIRACTPRSGSGPGSRSTWLRIAVVPCASIGQRLGPGAVRDLVDRHLVRVRVPRLDREPQVAHRRPDRVPGQRLVEVGVRVGRRRQQQEAVELEGRVRVARAERAARRRRPRRGPRRAGRRPACRRRGARAGAARWVREQRHDVIAYLRRGARGSPGRVRRRGGPYLLLGTHARQPPFLACNESGPSTSRCLRCC